VEQFLANRVAANATTCRNPSLTLVVRSFFNLSPASRGYVKFVQKLLTPHELPSQAGKTDGI
jgi:hypothetical protein